MPKVFIIVLHYKHWEDTNRCLESLKNLDYNNYEIVVINNDKQNRGFAGGNNIGIKQGLNKQADYILLLNNDTVVEPEFVKKLIAVGEHNSKFGILGPVIYEYNSKKIHFAGGKVNWLYTKGIHQQKIDKQKPIKVDYITGACLLIKREVIHKIGLMPEKYFLYLEDVDWCLRAQKAGYSCVLVPDSKISHKVSSSTKAGSFSYIYYHFRNGLLLAKQHAPFFIKILAYLWSLIILLKQLPKLLISSKKKWAKAIIKGVKGFYTGKFGKYENRN